LTPTTEHILEYWNERAAITQYDGEFPRDQSEIIARSQTTKHFGFDCFAVIQTERQRMAEKAKAANLAMLTAIPGIKTGRQMAEQH